MKRLTVPLVMRCQPFFVLFLLNCVGGYCTDNVSRSIDKLVAAGLVRDAIYAQRPWSRNEIARMVTEARRRLSEDVSSSDNPAMTFMAGEILERLEREYRDELSGTGGIRFHPLREADLAVSYLKSPAREVVPSNGVGRIDAATNPLTSYREGRQIVDGNTLAIETAHSAELSRRFSVYAQPRFDVLDSRDGSTSVRVRAQALYGKFNLRNLEIEVGRDALIWGHGEYGGVLASTNARNLDMVKISNESPFVHPWILKFLGPSKYTFFVANLGADYVRKNAYLYGLAASFKPASFLEMGFKHQITVAGEEAPDVGLSQLIREFFFVRDWGKSQESMDNREGVDIRVQIPPLRNAVVYAEGVFEDFGRDSFWAQFVEQMGFSSGIYFPLLTEDGSDDLRIEYEHSPAAYGRHSLYASGLTVGRQLRGSELGPDGTGVHVIWRHAFASGTQLRSEAHYEDRGSDVYNSHGPMGIDRVVRLTNNPKERRLRFVSSADFALAKGWQLRPRIGYERVRNYNFESGVKRHNFLGELSLRWTPAF